jgi:hypothetical protein
VKYFTGLTFTILLALHGNIIAMAPFFLFRLLFVLFTAGLILIAVLITIRYWFSFREKPVADSFKGEEQKILLPLRLQAFERIILFLERISPENLIMRITRPEMSAIQLQSELVKVIREEFEYNLSQQIYISATGWELVKNAKEETIRLINVASGKVAENASSGDLVRAILNHSMEIENLPVNAAIDDVKKEVQQLF